MINKQHNKKLRDEKIAEIYKCANDPAHFMKTYLEIQHPTKGRIPLDLYPFQEKVIDDFLENRFNIVLKSRQLGLSTITSAYCLWLAVFHRDKNIILVANKLEVCKNMVKKIKVAWQSLPKWMLEILDLVELDAESVKYVKFKNGSQITALPTTEDVGRSESASLVVVDEAAAIENLSECWKALYSTVTLGGNIIVFSCVNPNTFVYTPKGVKQMKDFMQTVPNSQTSGHCDYSVQGLGKVRTGVDVWNNGIVPTRTIKTSFGELECSTNHKLWSSINGQMPTWNEASVLNPEDWICHHYGQNLWGANDDVSDFQPVTSPKEWKNVFIPKKLTPNIMYLIGLYISEGSTYKAKTKLSDFAGGSLTITCGDDISGTLEKLGLSFSSWDGLHYTVGSKTMLKFLEHVGFDLTAKANNKKIPSRLLECSKPNIVAMLQGIFDGDGCAHNATGRVNISVSSKELVDQLRSILDNFGILTYRSSKTKEEMNAYGGKIPFNHDMHTLSAEGKHAATFYKEIGFRFQRKQMRSVLVPKRTEHGLQPEFYKTVFKDMFGSLGITTNKFKRIFGWKISVPLSKYRSLTIQDVKRLAEITNTKLPLDLIDPCVVWSRVKEITDGENQTCDFSLPNDPTDFWDHSVVYNNFLGHQTPQGNSNQFYKLWKDSVDKKNDFHRTELPWHIHPEHDQQWFDIETRGLDPRQIAEEFLCCFEGSGNTFFNTPTIEYVQKSIAEPIAYKGPTPLTSTDMWVWQFPNPTHKYVITADVSRGDAEDFSGFHVIDTTTWEQAAEYLGKIPPDRFGEFLAKVGYSYNTALVVNEKNAIGLVTSMKLRDLKYPNLYWENGNPHENYDLSEDERDAVIPGFTTKPGNRPGNREEILQKLSVALRDHHLKIYSSRFHEQMTNFIFTGKRGQAAKDKSDDLIMAAAWGCFVANPMGHHGTENVGNADWHNAFLASFTRSSKSISTGLNNFGQEHTYQQDPFMQQQPAQRQNQQQPEYYNGVKLKPGVKAENVRCQQLYRNVFDWLF